MGKTTEKKKITNSIFLLFVIMVVCIVALIVILLFKNHVDLQNTLDRLRIDATRYGKLIDLQIDENIKTVNGMTSFMTEDLSKQDIADGLIDATKHNDFLEYIYIYIY